MNVICLWTKGGRFLQAGAGCFAPRGLFAFTFVSQYYSTFRARFLCKGFVPCRYTGNVSGATCDRGEGEGNDVHSERQGGAAAQAPDRISSARAAIPGTLTHCRTYRSSLSRGRVLMRDWQRWTISAPRSRRQLTHHLQGASPMIAPRSRPPRASMSQARI
jgi:hypothetical protein